jgi:DNA-binding response OmpR family regulator
MIETRPSDQQDRTDGAPRIMFVDDDPAIVGSVGELLREQGYSVRAVTDPRRAVEAFEDFAPDLVILDVLMPSVDGISLCLNLRRESDVPVLFLSAKREPPDRVVGLRIGADDYMGKPFDNEELLARVGAREASARTPKPRGRCGSAAS